MRLSCLAVILGLLPALAYAKPADKQNKQEIDRLRRDLSDAERRLADAQRHEALLRDDMETLRRRQRDLPRQINEERQRIESLRRDVADAEKTIDQAKSSVSAAKARADERRPAARSAESALNDAKGATARVRADLTAAFEGGTECTAAKATTQAAQGRYDAAVAACMTKAAATPDFVDARTASEAAEANVKRLRGTPGANPSELAEASMRWIESKNRVEMLKRDALAADAPTVAASAELSAVQQNLKLLRSKFEAGLPQQPEMARALSEQSSAQKAHDSAAGELRRAEGEVGSAQKTLDAKQSVLKDGNQRIRKAEDDLRRRQDEQRTIDRDLRDAEQRLRRAQDETDRARRDRDDIARRLRDAQR
jgi:chromosome segregation ATPase